MYVYVHTTSKINSTLLTYFRYKNMPCGFANLQAGDCDPAHDNIEDEVDLLLKLPDDIDLEKFNRGRQFFKNNVGQCLVAMMLSLICGLSINRFLSVLVCTGRSSTPTNSYKRYMRTVIYVLKWHYGNVLDTSSSAFRSIRSVRNMHFAARKLMQDMQEGGREGVDMSQSSDLPNRDVQTEAKMQEGGRECVDMSQTSDLPNRDVQTKAKTETDFQTQTEVHTRSVYLSQYDMGLVQCGFMGAIILYPDKIGIHCSTYDLDDYVYFWRWIGYLLGIDDKYNICNGGYEQAYEICHAINQKVLVPSLYNPPVQFYPMTRAFVDGMNLPLISTESVIATYFRISGQKCPFSVSFVNLLRMYIMSALFYVTFVASFFAAFVNYFLEILFQCKKMS